MVLLWNKKMMSPSTDIGDAPDAKTDPDVICESTAVEQETIQEFAGIVPTDINSMTLNLTNYLSDFDAVAGSPLYRISEKESKGAANLANGKPRYYPAAYVEAMKETATQEEPEEPDEPVDPPTDPATEE